MCLYVRREDSYVNPHIATEDIICYKVLYRTSQAKYYTPFREVNCKLNSLFIANANDIYDPYDIINIVKSSGFIHAYTNLSTACKIRDSFNYLNKYNNIHYFCVECIIKKDTAYFIGMDNDICATSLFITSKIVS